jgi:hypothetical protein
VSGALVLVVGLAIAPLAFAELTPHKWTADDPCLRARSRADRSRYGLPAPWDELRAKPEATSDLARR